MVSGIVFFKLLLWAWTPCARAVAHFPCKGQWQRWTLQCGTIRSSKVQTVQRELNRFREEWYLRGPKMAQLRDNLCLRHLPPPFLFGLHLSFSTHGLSRVPINSWDNGPTPWASAAIAKFYPDILTYFNGLPRLYYAIYLSFLGTDAAQKWSSLKRMHPSSELSFCNAQRPFQVFIYAIFYYNKKHAAC